MTFSSIDIHSETQNGLLVSSLHHSVSLYTFVSKGCRLAFWCLWLNSAGLNRVLLPCCSSSFAETCCKQVLCEVGWHTLKLNWRYQNTHFLQYLHYSVYTPCIVRAVVLESGLETFSIVSDLYLDSPNVLVGLDRVQQYMLFFIFQNKTINLARFKKSFKYLINAVRILLSLSFQVNCLSSLTYNRHIFCNKHGTLINKIPPFWEREVTPGPCLCSVFCPSAPYVLVLSLVCPYLVLFRFLFSFR